MALLGTLLPTPRAAKKMVNLYRLVRIGIPEAELPTFITDASYQVVQILLSVLVGSPTASRTIFTEILHDDPERDLTDLLCRDEPTTVSMGLWAMTQPVRHRLVDRVGDLVTDHGVTLDPTLRRYQQWCPRLARYSFHTRTLAVNGVAVPRPARS